MLYQNVSFLIPEKKQRGIDEDKNVSQSQVERAEAPEKIHDSGILANTRNDIPSEMLSHCAKNKVWRAP